MVAISNTKVLLALGLALAIHSSHAIENNLRGAGAVSSESNTSVSAYLCVEILISLPCHLIFLLRQWRGALQLMAALRTCLMLLPAPGGSYPLLLFLPVSLELLVVLFLLKVVVQVIIPVPVVVDVSNFVSTVPYRIIWSEREGHDDGKGRRSLVVLKKK
jgi:hypothetical protein